MEQCSQSPRLPRRERVSALLSPHPVHARHPISKRPAGPHPTPRTLGVEVDRGPLLNGGSPLRGLIILSVSPTLINYFPLILLHVWKFFSNPHPDHDITEINQGRDTSPYPLALCLICIRVRVFDKGHPRRSRCPRVTINPFRWPLGGAESSRESPQCLLCLTPIPP